MKHLLFFGFLCLTTKGSFGQDTAGYKGDKPFVLGRIVDIPSKVLAERRTLNIYLPADYHENDSTQYPVIYLLDGSADEDFIHVAGLVQFLTFPWVHSLPNSIVVGIANVDRRRDFTFPTTIEKDKKDFPTTGQSGKFIGFLENELQPFVEKNYKTNGSKTLIGQSLGGLLATEVVFKKPSLFTDYLIVSPSLWWDRESLLSHPPKTLAPDFKNPISIFVAVGKEEKRMQDDANKLVEILRQGNKRHVKVYFEYFTNENHASILHNAVYKGLETLNKKTQEKAGK